jgi:hypothetical protein
LADPSTEEVRSLDLHQTGEMVADGAIESHLATREEILQYCTKGDYLGAGLLAAGRVFGGLPEIDPSVGVLLVAHHVCCGSEFTPWLDWCSDQDAATEVCRLTPESARLTLLVHLGVIVPTVMPEAVSHSSI